MLFIERAATSRGLVALRQLSSPLLARWNVVFQSTASHCTGTHLSHTALARVRDGDRVLDVGCGTGPLTRSIKELCPQSTVIGIDPSKKAIQNAGQRAKRKGLPIDYRLGVIEDLPFEDGSFDIVVSCMMLHHLPRDLKVDGLKEVYRILVPGGHIMMIDVGPGNRHWFSKFISFIYQWDLFEWLRDGIKGRLPAIMGEAGFSNAYEVFSGFTSMSYFWAEKEDY